VARHGWRLLPQYRFTPANGRWHHDGGQVEAPLSLHDVRYAASGMRFATHRHQEPESRLADYLAEARALLARPPAPNAQPQGTADLAVGPDFEGLRWFLMPDEAAAELAAEGAAEGASMPGEAAASPPGYQTGQ
jgi:hypothetical protein